MRLSERDRKSIKDTILSFDKKARVFLFGSRTDDSKTGGDIDLLILSDFIDASSKNYILVKLYDEIGEQKIDLVFTTSFERDPNPFIRLVAQEAVEL